MQYDLECGIGTKFHHNSQLFYEGKFSDGGPDGDSCILYHEDGSLK